MNGTSIYSDRYHRHTPWRPGTGERPHVRTGQDSANPATVNPAPASPATASPATANPATAHPAPASPATIPADSNPAATSDTSLIAILDAPLGEGETARTGFARKEQELGVAFAALPVLDQLALAKRLALPQPGDRLAEKLHRLTADRRQRLIQYLQDARRREALTKGRG